MFEIIMRVIGRMIEAVQNYSWSIIGFVMWFKGFFHE